MLTCYGEAALDLNSLESVIVSRFNHHHQPLPFFGNHPLTCTIFFTLLHCICLCHIFHSLADSAHADFLGCLSPNEGCCGVAGVKQHVAFDLQPITILRWVHTYPDNHHRKIQSATMNRIVHYFGQHKKEPPPPAYQISSECRSATTR